VFLAEEAHYKLLFAHGFQNVLCLAQPDDTLLIRLQRKGYIFIVFSSTRSDSQRHDAKETCSTLRNCLNNSNMNDAEQHAEVESKCPVRKNPKFVLLAGTESRR